MLTLKCVKNYSFLKGFPERQFFFLKPFYYFQLPYVEMIFNIECCFKINLFFSRVVLEMRSIT